MFIKSLRVEKFRGIVDQVFNLGEKITIVVGQNGTMKTTILGMISQPFSMRKGNMRYERTLDGSFFESKFQDKFKWSTKHDVPGDHIWGINYVDNDDDIKTFELKSALRKDRRDNTKIRFVNVKGKRREDSYIDYPVIFLSLKRVTPIGEEHNEKITAPLTDEEKDMFIEAHNNILSIMDPVTEINSFKTHNKNSLLVDTSDYDYLLNSAGQDNVGKIIGAIISFKRLKEKYPEDYKGGLLVIDEADATLFPSAQEQLMKVLLHWSSILGLQVLVTTHSISIIKMAYDNSFKRVTNLLYLKKVGGKITGIENPEFERIIADLNIDVFNENECKKIRLYLEDNVGYYFVCNLIPYSIRKRLEIMKDVSLGAENYINLVKSGVNEFKRSIIVLDGDKEKLIKKHKYNNFVSLPTFMTFPEDCIFDFLYSLDETDCFWDNRLGGYNKQMCFKGYAIKPTENAKIKKWFNEQKQFWGKNCNRLLKAWIRENSENADKFVKKVEKVLSLLES